MMNSLAAIATICLAIGSPPTTDGGELQHLQHEAQALLPFVKSEIGRAFLRATAALPKVSPRTVFRDPDTHGYYTRRQLDDLEPAVRARLETRTLDETFYYTTKYGSPLAYVRAIDLLGQAGLDGVAGAKVLDFGYGTIGHLRLLASLGADVVGVDVDSQLAALYSEPADQGEIEGRGGGPGRLSLIDGSFPTERNVVEAVGDGYDLVLSKNTLKNGYLHPSRPVDPRRLVQLGVDDETFLRALYRILKPGGRVMIYNLFPSQAPPDQPYKPWADGRCPFPKRMWESAGFKVLSFDVNDDKAARAMGRLLGWDQGEGAMDLEHDLFALYTLAEKPQ